MVSKYTKIFCTFPSKLDIRDSMRHLVLNYLNDLHRCIQTKMDFLDISSLGDAYRYIVKIEKNFKQWNKQEFKFTNMQ